MPPVKTDTGHGGLYDLFPEHAQSTHGGNLFDEGFGLQDKPAGPHGRNFDDFTAERGGTGHGELWDEFAAWKPVTDIHGQLLYDEGFASPTAHASEHGPLFDLFQAGTQVRFIFDGKDAEGIVQGVTPDGVTVQPRGGGNAVEVGLQQFLEFASPSLENASTVAPRSTADSPSAWDSTAHGAGRTGAPEPGQPVAPVAPGPGNPDARAEGIPAGSLSIVDSLKSVLDDTDIAKGGMGFGGDSAKLPCEVHHVKDVDFNHHVLWQHPAKGQQVGLVTHSDRGSTHVRLKPSGNVDGPSTRVARAHISHIFQSDGSGYRPLKGGPAHVGKTAPSDLVKSYSLFGRPDIAKDVTAAETAVQAENAAAVFCPECRSSKRTVSKDGRCPDCNTVLKAHDGSGAVPREKGDGNGSSESSAGKGVAEKTSTVDDLRKAFGASGDAQPGGQTDTVTGREKPVKTTGKATSDPTGPDVPAREHKSTDHHEDGEGARSCPFCGQAIAELDTKAEEGAPTHKCIESFLDTLKVAA